MKTRPPPAKTRTKNSHFQISASNEYSVAFRLIRGPEYSPLLVGLPAGAAIVVVERFCSSLGATNGTSAAFGADRFPAVLGRAIGFCCVGVFDGCITRSR